MFSHEIKTHDDIMEHVEQHISICKNNLLPSARQALDELIKEGRLISLKDKNIDFINESYIFVKTEDIIVVKEIQYHNSTGYYLERC